MVMDDATPLVVPPAARRLWCALAGVPDALTPSTTTIVRGSRGICSEGWIGIVRLGDAYLIEAGEADDETVEVLCSLDDPSDPKQVTRALRPKRTRGPGHLAYLPPGGEVAAISGADDIDEATVESITPWLKAIPAKDVAESSVSEMNRVLVLRRADRLVGAAGHVDWPADIAHIGVLIAPYARGAGLGARLGAAATRRAQDHGRQPQWRAAAWNAASRFVARRVGYVEIGRQFSFDL